MRLRPSTKIIIAFIAAVSVASVLTPPPRPAAADVFVPSAPTEEAAVTPEPPVEAQVLGAASSGEAVRFFVWPMADALDRITKKPFGIEIHPETSPVPGDHFDGYHVGVDFETFEDEQDIDVPVFAICEGPLLFKKQAQGYGGVAVQGCVMDGRDVSVIYGHLRVASVEAEAGHRFAAGERIGFLGKGHSEETDGVRKHLHLGIREGRTLDIRGYVKDPEEMRLYLDALDYLPH